MNSEFHSVQVQCPWYRYLMYFFFTFLVQICGSDLDAVTRAARILSAIIDRTAPFRLERSKFFLKNNGYGTRYGTSTDAMSEF